PLPPATSRYCPLWVNASPSGSATGTFWTAVGTNLAVFMTTSGAPLRSDTKPRWLRVTTTSKGFPPTWTNSVRTFGSGFRWVVAVVHPGGGRTRVVVVGCRWPPPSPPPPLRSADAPPAAASTRRGGATTARVRRAVRRGGAAGGPGGRYS